MKTPIKDLEAYEKQKEKDRIRMREKRKNPEFLKKDRERTKAWSGTESGKASAKRSWTRYSRLRGHQEQTVDLGRRIASKCLHQPEVIEKNRATALAKKDSHHLARTWSLISPEGRTFRVRNLGAFIRDNLSLFDEAIWGKRSWESIYNSLCQLSPRRKEVRGVIFGWRWHIVGHHHDTLLSVIPFPTAP